LVGQNPDSLLDPNDPTGAGMIQEEAVPAGIAPTPGNPFGIPFGSSSTPGIVTPVPDPQ